MKREILEEIGKELAEKMTKEISANTCTTFPLGYVTSKIISSEEYDILTTEGNADIMSEVFEKEVGGHSWAENLCRITVGVDQKTSEVFIYAYTKMIISSQFVGWNAP